MSTAPAALHTPSSELPTTSEQLSVTEDASASGAVTSTRNTVGRSRGKRVSAGDKPVKERGGTLTARYALQPSLYVSDAITPGTCASGNGVPIIRVGHKEDSIRTGTRFQIWKRRSVRAVIKFFQSNLFCVLALRHNAKNHGKYSPDMPTIPTLIYPSADDDKTDHSNLTRS